MFAAIVWLLIAMAIVGAIFLAITIFAIVVPIAVLVAIGAAFFVLPVMIIVRILRWGIR